MNKTEESTMVSESFSEMSTRVFKGIDYDSLTSQEKKELLKRCGCAHSDKKQANKNAQSEHIERAKKTYVGKLKTRRRVTGD